MHPGITEWQRDLSISHNNLGNLAVTSGDLTAARTAFTTALTIRQQLADTDPGNTQWQRDLESVQQQLLDFDRTRPDQRIGRRTAHNSLDSKTTRHNTMRPKAGPDPGDRRRCS